MNEMETVLHAAKAVLDKNDRGSHTVPAEGLYPHQWLWDSCFIAIGLRHYDLDRAQNEIMSLFAGQWANGMLPHMIFSHDTPRTDLNIWRSWVSPQAPDCLVTSGITQPPMMAEAIVAIGKKMKKPERHLWFESIIQPLTAYHQWLYTERDPHHEGLVIQIHPWETGLDNTPPWMRELHEHQLPLWVQAVKTLHLSPLFNLFRRDTRFVPASQRLSTLDALALLSVQRRLRRKQYDINRILSHSLFAIEDVSFNAILIRANQHLRDIAKTIRHKLPEELLANMDKTIEAFEQLYDPYSGQYYSREFVAHRLLKEQSIGTLMPLYAGTVTKERAAHLVTLLKNERVFGAKYPVPSVPLGSDWFKSLGYWQGPSWVNTNWLIIDGLRRYGYHDEADEIAGQTYDMIRAHGNYEYFSALDGSPGGAHDFSWTAALIIDLLHDQS